MLVQIKNLNLRYDPRKTDGVYKLNLNIPQAKVLALIGPSGSGKTTTLKCLANLESPQSGTIEYKGDLTIAYVDQTPKFDEELSVYDVLENEIVNIEDAEKRSNQVRTTLALLEITNEIHSLMKNISGGQRQRVVIAMALVKNPTLLLLDEPFANLDRTLRLNLLEELFDIFKEKGITVVWVTHNTDEALAYSDYLALLNFGELQQFGPPQDLYFKPQNSFTATFLSEANLITGKLVVAADESTNELNISILGKEYIVPRPKDFISKEHNDILAIIRPEYIVIDSESKDSATIEKRIFKGERTLLVVNYQGQELTISVSSSDIPTKERIPFSINSAYIYCLSEL